MTTANQVLNIMRGWLGYSEYNGKYKFIINIYNNHKPLPRGYKVKYSDEWCDTTISAAFILAGGYDLIGAECSCEKHIQIFKNKGIWIESGRIKPLPGDIILFNWNDKTQPNDGHADHIGIVERIYRNQIYTIEGNKGKSVARRILPIGAGCIRGYARPKYSAKPNSKPPLKPKKNNVDIALEVIQGKWGNGKDREKKLKTAGYNIWSIQWCVNEILKKNYIKIANEVIQGKWGNGKERENRLKAKGYEYDIIRNIVNSKLK